MWTCSVSRFYMIYSVCMCVGILHVSPPWRFAGGPYSSDRRPSETGPRLKTFLMPDRSPRQIPSSDFRGQYLKRKKNKSRIGHKRALDKNHTGTARLRRFRSDPVRLMINAVRRTDLNLQESITFFICWLKKKGKNKEENTQS